MLPPNVSLVKYDVPVLISKKQDNKNPNGPPIKSTRMAVQDAGPVPSSGIKPCTKPPCDTRNTQQTDEILNSILPPREWTDNNQLWIQQVSSTPATRLDVVNLQEELDRRLQQRQARETGICPVRRELYSQVFDELIRQVTINCTERGLLLLRVRDEIRMTIAAYQTLYESSVAFGMRKALQAEQGRAELDKKILELEAYKRELERQVTELKAKCEQIEKRAAEQRQVEEKKHQDEIQFLKRNNQQLKTQLEGIINPKK
ncbi:33 kDa inner dynein arm light chain, axonemal [Echinococcus granulosus]|uniref:Inner dynein arm light chain, axonemal n=2 Tax=Echinococcus granulosus TaxID=6210 RepID=W6UWG5_ECHGR|nr:inner dynein arm light chain, axonemal [Echinococcus granulosus]EUB57824.1 inner dynein arm light chain, axonemal [Echinococcus granulosus]KAH9279181.1 33 kDa inner dynein arm light chain, axonemal [Echinococcus granulosus]